VGNMGTSFGVKNVLLLEYFCGNKKIGAPGREDLRIVIRIREVDDAEVGGCRPWGRGKGRYTGVRLPPPH